MWWIKWPNVTAPFLISGGLQEIGEILGRGFKAVHETQNCLKCIKG